MVSSPEKLPRPRLACAPAGGVNRATPTTALGIPAFDKPEPKLDAAPAESGENDHDENDDD